MNDYRLSIIIPTFNCEKYIEKALKSLDIEKNKECEVIVIDDYSTDNTVKVCEQFQIYNNFRLILKKKNEGVSSARNKGIIASKAPYLLFLDADDEIVENTIEGIINILNNDEFDFHIWGCEEYINNSKVNVYLSPERHNNRKDFLNQMFMNDLLRKIRYGVLWGKVYKKQLIIDNNIFFDETTNIGEDTWFNIMYYGFMNSISIHSEVIYKHISREHSLSKLPHYNFGLLYKETLEKYTRLFKNNGKSNNSLFLLKKFIESRIRLNEYKRRKH